MIFPTLFHLEVSHHDSLKVYFSLIPNKKGWILEGFPLQHRASEWFLLARIPDNPLQKCFLSIGISEPPGPVGGSTTKCPFPRFLFSVLKVEGFSVQTKKMWQPTCTRCFSSGVWIEWLMQCHEGTIFQREINVNYKLQWCRNCCFLMLPILWGYQQLAKRLGV